MLSIQHYRLKPINCTCFITFPLSPLAVTVIHGEFVDLPPNGFLRSLAEEETTLPCRYQPSEGGLIVQVEWFKDGEQIIIAHHKDGQSGEWTLWYLQVTLSILCRVLE